MVNQTVNYAVAHAGIFSNLLNVTAPPMQGKYFLKDLLQLNSMEVSLNVLPAGEGVPFYHTHKENEELYIVIKGKGQFQVDGEVFDVQEGSAVRVAPEGIRTLRNRSDEDLCFVVIQARANSLNQWVFTDGVILEEPVRWE